VHLINAITKLNGIAMLRSWELNIELNKSSADAIYLQLVQKITEAIQSNRILPSSVMPGTRALSTKLGVNRKTVIMAYDELIAEGWLVTEKRRGTFVNTQLPNRLGNSKVTNQHKASAVIQDVKNHQIKNVETMQDVICFNNGTPDTRLIPFNLLSRAFRHALVISSRANRLGYENAKGMMLFRQSITNMLNMERGLNIELDNVCSIRGSQMGIFITARILIKSNDIVVVEKFTYPYARDAFESCGAKIIAVEQDKNGIDLTELEQLCREVRIRAVYVTPQHQYPTTVILNKDRRLRLQLLAEQYDFMIIEDDYDHEFNYTNTSTFPIASNDNSGRVIYIGSFSTVLAPALRVGFLVASKEIINQCASEISLIDRQGNAITELAMSELMNSGEIKRQILKNSKMYKSRRDALDGLIRDQLSLYVDFDKPDGGLAFWLRIKKEVDPNQFMEHAQRYKVAILPDCLFSKNNNKISAIRLGFASLNEDEMASGIGRLKKVFASLY
jgi:GntR family transcriptional regulator / MocR family aminotransferase